MFWKLLKALNQTRQAYPEYLLYGKMLSDAVTVSGETLEEFDSEGYVRTYPAYYHTTWEAPDGRRALIVVNYLDREQQISIDGKTVSFYGCSAQVFTLN